MEKRAIEFNFAVLFSIIVGAIIIFLAIYSSFKVIHTGTSEQESSLTKQLTIIFDPMETGIASGKYSSVSFSENSRIYNECSNEGEFGYQRFSFSTYSLGKWGEKNLGQKINNKYVFSEKVEEGKKAYLFSKPFNFPFKVSELIFFTTKTYCFQNAPDFIKDEVTSMEIQNIKLGNCSSSDIKVCFGTGSCDIKVIPKCNNDCGDFSEYEYGEVIKSNKTLTYYSDSLLYAAIFSSPEIYTCNVNRLMKRLASQAELLGKESYYVSTKCGVIPREDLLKLSSSALSSSLQETGKLAKEINEKNNAASCELW